MSTIQELFSQYEAEIGETEWRKIFSAHHNKSVTLIMRIFHSKRNWIKYTKISLAKARVRTNGEEGIFFDNSVGTYYVTDCCTKFFISK